MSTQVVELKETAFLDLWSLVVADMLMKVEESVCNIEGLGTGVTEKLSTFFK